MEIVEINLDTNKVTEYKKTFQVWAIKQNEQMLLSEHEKLNDACQKIEVETKKSIVCFLTINKEKIKWT